MSIEHQTALSIIDAGTLPALRPSILPKTRSRIWLVMIGAIFGAGMQLGVTSMIHRVQAEHRAVALRHHRAHAMWQMHHLPACHRAFVRN